MLSRVKLISEPWDIGPGGYQLGHHPPGFAEWNDRFRDGIRRFWRGDAGQRARFRRRASPARATCSTAARAGRGRRSTTSPRHDGFTLADVVSYAERHNEANGEDNRDGHGENYSANWGVEGPTDDPAIIETRAARAARAARDGVLLARHADAARAATSSGARQRGNNNAYCQDNEISWLDWKQAEGEEGRRSPASSRG